MISVVVPAYNEENVIARCLKPLLPGVISKELEIVVVCNGCTDKTPQIVAEFKENVTLIETMVSSKTNALNLGDQVASGFPRFYLDADVVISLEAVRKVAEVLDSGFFLAAAPQMKMRYQHSSWFVRAYYDIWQQLPYVRKGMIGVGLYALSQEGRARFKDFPDIIADDRFVRALFKESERTAVNGQYSLVTAPATLNDLLKIKTRSRLGGYEFEKKFPHLINNEEKKYGTAVMGTVLPITNLFKMPIYLFVNIKSRIVASSLLKKNELKHWTRDNSSRTHN